MGRKRGATVLKDFAGVVVYTVFALSRTSCGAIVVGWVSAIIARALREAASF